jgi:lipopolysaccharide transport system ATP-binding protein
MTSAIHFDDVSKCYRLGLGAGSLRSALSDLFRGSTRTERDEIWALKDVSFEIAPGEAVGLVGPNGAGKSTALRLLAGITQPSSGSIDVEGRVSALLELGAGFHPELTGRENIYLYGSILGLKRTEIRDVFDSIVAFSELERFLNTPLKRYSSGMYVRLAFAVAAHVQPDILLVDEVLAVGDASFRQKCMDRMSAMLGDGITLVFVSHNPHMVQMVCQRAIYLGQGRLRADGEAEDVLRTYEQDLRHIGLASAADRLYLEEESGAGIEIRAIAILDLHGDARNTFDYNEGGKVRVAYRAPQAIIAPVLHVRLFRDDGTVCFTIRSNQRDAPLDGVVLEGDGEFALWLASWQLYGGVYRVSVAILDSSDEVIMAKGYSPWFEVGGPGSFSGERLGIFVPSSKWEVDTLTPQQA